MLRGSYKRVLDLGAENFSEAEEVQCLAASAGVAILGRQTVTGVLPVWLGVHGRYRCRWQEEEAGPESDAGIRKVFPPPLVLGEIGELVKWAQSKYIFSLPFTATTKGI